MPDNENWTDRNNARPMPLAGGPASEAASSLVDRMIAEMIVPRQARTLRPSSRVKLGIALGSLLADLVRHYQAGVWGKHGMSPSDFPAADLGFGRDTFLHVRDALIASGLLSFVAGRTHVSRSDLSASGFIRSTGPLSIFSLLPAFGDVAGRLLSDPWEQNWRIGKAKASKTAPRLQLRASKVDGETTGQAMPTDPEDPEAAAILADIHRMNDFLDTQDIAGISFVGLRRIFNDGDVEGKRWLRGGRYYPLKGGDLYQNLSGDVRRSTIRIGGEPVAEVDISASHLTLLYGIQGLPFDATDGDPYGVEGIDRLPVKLWINDAIGKERANSVRWASGAGKAYKEANPGRKIGMDFRASNIRMAALSKHPILEGLATFGLKSVDFQYRESDILRLSMAALRDNHNVPSLPVHDSLLVPVSAVEVTKEVMREAFLSHFKGLRVVPRLTVKGD